MPASFAPPADGRVLAPSDVWFGTPAPPGVWGGTAQERRVDHPGREVLVGGRALAVGPDGRTIVLADAFATVDVELVAPAGISPGDLAVVAGELGRARVSGARVVHRVVCAEGRREQGESARFLRGDVGRALAARAAGVRAIRSWFDEQRFLEVDTPALVPSPGLDVHLDAFQVPAGPQGAAYLMTSPEYQMKRLLVGGIPRCFQLAHCYRRGEHGERHNPEFLMLEWYRAFAGVDDVMDDTERLVRTVAEAIGGAPAVELGDRRVDLRGPFQRMAVAEAFARWGGVSADEALEMAAQDETRFFRTLAFAVEPALAAASHPVFLIDWPAPLASLARLSPRDRRVSERFELYLGGVELCNGFGELTDAAEQRARFERDRAERARLGLPVYPMDERFLSALEEGMPPAAGNALGVDRLVALCLGLGDIRSVQAFPIDVL